MTLLLDLITFQGLFAYSRPSVSVVASSDVPVSLIQITILFPRIIAILSQMVFLPPPPPCLDLPPAFSPGK